MKVTITAPPGMEFDIQSGPPEQLALTVTGEMPLTIITRPPGVPPDVTRGQLMHAIRAAGQALGYGEQWWGWLVERAGLAAVLSTEQARRYDGPPLDGVNWSMRETAAVVAALQKFER